MPATQIKENYMSEQFLYILGPLGIIFAIKDFFGYLKNKKINGNNGNV